MTVVIAVDAGTTGVRSVAVGEDGRPRAFAYRALAQHFPRPGWVEHDPVEIAAAVSSTLGEVATSVAEAGDTVAGVGVTNQRETAVAWDRRSGRPLHRAVVWSDRRTAQRCRDLRHEGLEPAVRATTGLVLDPYFSATKFEWLLGEGGLEANGDLALGTVDSWVVWCLTGGAAHVTDPGNASRTMLFDITAGAWSQELCERFGVPASALGEVRPSCGRVGMTEPSSAAGLRVPVAAMAGDQQAALFGQACLAPGMTKNTYGTGSFVLMNLGGGPPPEPPEGLLTTVAWSLGGALTYALEGAVFSTGSGVQWLRDGLGIITEAADCGPLAAGVDHTDGLYLVPAFSGLGSPWWDPGARAALIGLSRTTGRAQMARAVVEAMAHQTVDVLRAMEGAGGMAVTELRVDGGASVMDVLCQFQADLARVPVRRPAVTETTALGAAYLAGLAEGVWSSVDEVAAHWQADAEYTPVMSERSAGARHAAWLRAVERARSWPDG
ncbi:MAG: FGGY family carbohydrate kinase [Acidimicrobiia bacterium]